MKDTVPRVPLYQEVVDTFLICLVFLLSAYFGEALPFRLVIVFCLAMSFCELLIAIWRMPQALSERGACVYMVMQLVLCAAINLMLDYVLDWRLYVLWIFTVTASDASGLLAGRLFGAKRPFFSAKISPNKTYAGYLGEIVGSISFGLVIIWLLKIEPTRALRIYVFTVAIASAIGDLLGSAAKRVLGIKDSSEYLVDLPWLGKIEQLMRSRHGFLDCFDSASVAFIYFITLIEWCS